MDPPKHPKQEKGAFPIPSLSFERRTSRTRPVFRLPLYSFSPTSPHKPPLYYTMAGPIRSSPTSSQRVVQPPRPPNAWILYRSDKVRELPPVEPGTPRRAQAEVSKMISDMWKSAPERVRQHYEQLAEAKKAEHQAMYPGYRFQPMKKEEKERLKEEKRLEKEKDRAQSRRHRGRPAPYPMAVVAPAMPHVVQIYQPELHYGSEGPSPPLSAASSPNYNSPTPESQFRSEQISSSRQLPSSHASPSPNTSTSGSTTVQPLPTQPLLIAAPQPGVAHAPLPDANLWQPSPQSSVGTSTWSHYGSVQSHLNAAATEGLSLDVDAQNLQCWPSSENDPFSRWLQASLSPTGDANIFSMSGVPPNFDFESLEGELQLSLGLQDQTFVEGPMPQISSFAQDMFSQYDMSADAGPSSQSTDVRRGGLVVSPAQHSSDVSFLPSHEPLLQDTSSSHEQRGFGFNCDMMQFLNFEPSNTSPPRPGPPHAHSFHMPLQESNVDTAASAQTPYQPPTGATNSGTRRVAASWKHAIISGADSPLDHSPPRGPWGVSAS